MSFILEGTINGMRPVSGVTTSEGKNKGSYWHFLSMEVCDSRFGQVYSCQLRSNDKELFEQFVKIGAGVDKNGQKSEVGSLLQDLTGHSVKLLIKGVSAGERVISTPAKGASFAKGAPPAKPLEEIILQVRFYVGGIKDLGLPKNDDF
ncbi:MAG: hypothetical protein ABI234_17865 [Ktedonobacteraceae bacterium]